MCSIGKDLDGRVKRVKMERREVKKISLKWEATVLSKQDIVYLEGGSGRGRG